MTFRSQYLRGFQRFGACDCDRLTSSCLLIRVSRVRTPDRALALELQGFNAFFFEFRR